MMISELLGEAVGIIGDAGRSKHSINNNGVVLGSSSSCTSSPSLSPALSPSPSPSSSTVTTPTSSSTSAGGGGAENHLRCPRCDSTNTKFCYYNNYNLTQPRHFCKTCRRYWTKGGALRNVPIGGGCRKNKTAAAITSSAVLKSTASAGKFRAMTTEIGKSGLIMSNFDHDYPSSASNTSTPILWTSPDHHNSHMLSLLRVNQNPNPNPNPGPMSGSLGVKEEVSVPAGPHRNSSQTQTPVLGSGAPNARILGLDASFGMISTSSLWRDNERQQIGFILGEAHGAGGAHEVYQRLRSSANHSTPPAGNEAIVLGGNNNINVVGGSASSSSLTILDSAPVASADQLGCWINPILSWSDLPTSTHGAYP